MPFTTKDRYNDQYYVNCADRTHGAWWFSRSCVFPHLNGEYLSKATYSYYRQGIGWNRNWKLLQKAYMMIRRL